MRKLTYFVASTIDGFIATPERDDPTGHSAGFFLMEGDHFPGMFADYPDLLPTVAQEMFGVTGPNRAFDTVVEGRVSYEGGLKAGITNAYTHLRHIVFSTTLTSPDATVEVVGTDPAAKIRELKAEDGLGIWLVGGGTLAYSLRDEIDELIVKLHPSALGSGAPMFDGPFSPQAFTLVDFVRYESGVVILKYAKR